MNPHFGKWRVDDEIEETEIYGTVPSSEEEALSRMSRVKNSAKRRRKAPEPASPVRAKPAVRVRSLFSGPRDFDASNPYKRPFTREEAREVLSNAGLGQARVRGAYVAGWPGCDCSEPLGRCQVIEADILSRRVHLFLQYVRHPREGWKIYRYMLVG